MNRVSISLNRNDWGQIVDGLEARRASWEVTMRYLEGEEVDQAIEECRDVEEARALITTYDRLIGELCSHCAPDPDWRPLARMKWHFPAFRPETEFDQPPPSA